MIERGDTVDVVVFVVASTSISFFGTNYITQEHDVMCVQVSIELKIM